MTKDELLQREAAAWDRLLAAISQVPAERRTEPGVVPGWSVQDLYWHCAYWSGWCGERLEAMAAGTFVDEDHPDEFWDNLNEKVTEEARGMTWIEIEEASGPLRERVRGGLQALPELTDTAVEEYADETFVHYDEHAAEIEAFAGAA